MTAADPSAPDAAPARVDVVCLGESMVAFRPAAERAPLADAAVFARGIGGAESNVACALAAAGHRTQWVGRVGTDAFGDHLVAAIAAYGVDVSAVQRDPARPTGVYFRTAGERSVGLPAPPAAPPGDGGPPLSEVLYYRAGSAASAMSPALVPRATAWSGRVLHLTGITAALSAGCLALLRALTERRPGRPLVSFDVNYRTALWRNAPDGPAVLASLARRSDLVFVGEDEAEAAWGLHGAAAIRSALPEPRVLVVKRGAAGATAYVRTSAETFTAVAEASADGPGAGGAHPEAGVGADAGDDAGLDAVVTVPAPSVDVVAPVGAGDAFAAGFLSGTLRGLTPGQCLRHGHLMAAAALTAPGDLAAPPRRDHADRLAALGPAEWGRLRLGPGWTTDAMDAPDTPGTPDTPDTPGTPDPPEAPAPAAPVSAKERTP
ncbi:sugar kinase [Streptomyces sp. VNUA116]|uniref:sugar kinase n=1 Tax=Streptomyces sp. VNUA116 TaxID=3062449 RepID=UPI0026758D4F|nr:sugar kinase [Streptomyces sp. VNUA116]WKU46675.1 sugar kinase [Streptomyces sp. VNUA116]